GVEVVGDVGVDVCTDAFGQHGPKLWTSCGLQAELQQREVAGAEGRDPLDDAVHLLDGRGTVVWSRNARRERGGVGLESLVDASAGLGEQVVAVAEVVGRR